MESQHVIGGDDRRSTGDSTLQQAIGKGQRVGLLEDHSQRSRQNGWTDEEDSLLVKYYEELGNNWEEIAKRMPGRAVRAVMARWYTVVKPWTDEEDATIVKSFETIGSEWEEIAKLLPGRNACGVRHRWCKVLKPNSYTDPKIKGGWTDAEDAFVTKCHRELGYRWGEIAKLMPGRSCDAIKMRWYREIKPQADE